MATKSFIFNNIQKIRNFSSIKRTFTGTKIIYNKENFPPPFPEVEGLSSAVLQVPNNPVGPGASKDSSNYKNPEYFSYHKESYYEAEIEMLKYRCPQPTNKEPYEHEKPN